MMREEKGENKKQKRKRGCCKREGSWKIDSNYDGDFNNYELFVCVVFLVTVLAGG